MLVRDTYVLLGTKTPKSSFARNARHLIDIAEEQAFERCAQKGGTNITLRGTTAMVRGDWVVFNVYLDATRYIS